MSDTPRVDKVRALKYGNVKAMDALAEALERELAAALARVRELEGDVGTFQRRLEKSLNVIDELKSELGMFNMGFTPKKD